MRQRIQQWFGISMAMACLWACFQLDDAGGLSGPAGKLAVGAYHTVRFGDACSGGGKLNFCSSEFLVTLDSLTSTDTSVLRIVPAQSADIPIQSDGFYLYGVKAGKSTIRASGKFTDGSNRTDERIVEVRDITGLQFIQPCNQDSSTTLRGIPGATVNFEVQLLAGKERIFGCPPGLLDSVPGLAYSCSDWSSHFTWLAPAQPTSIPLTSPYLKGPVAQLKTLQPEDITDVRWEPVNSPPFMLYAPDSFAMYVKMSYGNHGLCEAPEAVLRTLTPKVCGGPQGETTWVRPTDGYVYLRGLQEGQCQLQASLDSLHFFGPQSYDLFFNTKPDPTLDFAGFGNPCSHEGATTCSYGLKSMALCKSGHWSESTQCGSHQICDFRPNTEKTCVLGASCSYCRDPKK